MSEETKAISAKEGLLQRLLGFLFGRDEEDEDESLGVLSRAAKLPPREKPARPQ